MGQDTKRPKTPTPWSSAAPKEPEFSDKEDITLSHLLLKPKDLSVVSLIGVFSTLSSIFFSIVLYLYFVTYFVNSHVCLWVLFLIYTNKDPSLYFPCLIFYRFIVFLSHAKLNQL